MFSEARALFSEGGLITQFVDVVMAPEMFLRNYQTFFTISKSEAQQDMKNPNGCTYASDSSTELLSQPSPKSNSNSNLGLAGQHNWS